MKTHAAAALASLAILVAAITPATAGASVLVASGDEWTLSNYAYQAPYLAGTQGFAASLAQTFGGSRYLLLTGNANVTGASLSNFAAQLTALGKTVAYSNTFSAAALVGYDAVFHFGQTIDHGLLDAYVAGGHDAYISLGAGYYGTAAAEANAWNPLLAEYGLVAGSTWFSAPAFVQAHVTSGPPGATSLLWGYGQSIDKLTPASSSVSYLRGSFDGGPTDIGLVGASRQLGATVPEPATWAMMLVGFVGLGAMLRRRRAEAVLA